MSTSDHAALPRSDAIALLADAITSRSGSNRLRVAMDGRTASGKTTLANEIAAHLLQSGRTVIHTSIDGFHNPRSVRYAQGRRSAKGYYEDARDLTAIREHLLDPLGPNESGVYVTQTFDLDNDTPVILERKTAGKDDILLVDGTFLQRPELRDGWDFVIYVDVSRQTSLGRGIDRDQDLLAGRDEAEAVYSERYIPAFDLYCSYVDPRAGADCVWLNEDLELPTLMLRK